MDKTSKSNDQFFPSAEQLRNLANRLRAAYKKECERGECQCVTVEEHERSLAR